MSTIQDLPENVARRLMSFFTQTDGEQQVSDMAGFISFIAEYGETYPILLSRKRTGSGLRSGV